MTPLPGQDSGQARHKTPAGYSWGEYVGALIAAEGSLAALAQKLLLQTNVTGDVMTIERALRRLRSKGQHDGGAWGQRLVRLFGLPLEPEARVRFMGLYHSSFNDLPLAHCLDLLRLWDRPPVSNSRARSYVQLGLATCALRDRNWEQAQVHFRLAASALAGAPSRYADAELELELGLAYLASQLVSEPGPAQLLTAALKLERTELGPAERACFRARLIDQQAFVENRRGTEAGWCNALQAYLSLSDADIHPFSKYRREAGLAYTHHKLGQHEQALLHTQRAIEAAGDGGYRRLRVMGLLLEVKILGSDAVASLDRAFAIAQDLGDRELLARVERLKSPPARVQSDR